MAMTVEQIKRVTVQYAEQGREAVAAGLDQIVQAQMGVAQSGAAASRASLSVERQYAQLLRQLDPLAKATQDYENGVRRVAAALSQGFATSDQAAATLLTLKGRVDAARKATEDHTNVVALNHNQMRNLSFQLNDVATMLLSGSSPFQVMATQGGQVYQVLQDGPGGVSGSLKDLAGRLFALMTPARVVTAGLVGVAASGLLAWSAWDDKIKAITVSLNGLGRATGLSTGGLVDIASAAASRGQLSSSAALSSAAAFAGGGIDRRSIENLLSVSKPFAGAFNLTIDDGREELLKMFRDPAQGISEFSKRFGVLGFETEQQIRRLQATGRTEEARQRFFEALDKALKGTTDATSGLTRAVNAGKDALDGLWTWLGKRVDEGMGAPSPSRDLRNAQYALDSRKSSVMGWLVPENLRYLESFVQVAQAHEFLAGEADFDRSGRAKGNAQAAVDSYNKAASSRIIEESQLMARSILATTAAQKLAIEQERIALAVKYDSAKAATQAADAEKARNIAIAESQRLLQDNARKIENEIYVGSARTDAERVRRQTEVEFRDFNRQLLDASARTPAVPSLTASPVANSPIAAATLRAMEGLTDEMRRRLTALIEAVPGISITSGFRDRAQQEYLYRTRPGYAARPGTSPHERGVAADLAFSNDNVRREAHRVAPSVGLDFPLANRAVRPEPWHVEMARGTRSSAGADSERVLSVDEQQRKIQDYRLRQLWEPGLDELGRSLGANEKMLQAQAAAFGKSTYEGTKLLEMARMRSDIEKRGIDINRLDVLTKTELLTKIEQLAAGQARYAVALEQQQREQTRAVGRMDSIRDGASDLLSSSARAAARGENVGEAARQSVQRTLDRVMDSAFNNLVEDLLGTRGKAGGGLFGDLLSGLLGTQNTAMMTVTAGMVNVNGGVGAGVGEALSGSGGGSLFGSIGKSIAGFFGFADGGIMTSLGPVPLRKYAAGGIANSAQAAIFGEGSTPEAFVPLPDGRSIPVSLQDTRQTAIAAAQPPAVNVKQGDVFVNVSGDGARVQKVQQRRDAEGNTHIDLKLIMEEMMRDDLSRNGPITQDMGLWLGARRVGRS